jgi:transcriptional regulator with XRE-family HTH domain
MLFYKKNMNFNDECSNRLREERKRLGFSQQEMANLSGVRTEMWGRYERGEAAPGADALVAFGLAGGDVQYVLLATRTTSVLTIEEKELVSGFRALDIRGKARVLGVIDGMSPESNVVPKGTAAPSTGGIQIGGDVGGHVNQGGQIYSAPVTINVGDKKKKKKPLAE